MREMKDSGIEWIGLIPSDWTVNKLNNVASKITDFVASGSFADINQNVEYLDDPDYAMLVRTADLSGTKEKRVYINRHAYEYLCNSNLFGGEIILSNIGSVGNVFIYEPLYERSSLAPNAIMVDGCQCNRYVYYWFLNPLANKELKRIGGNAVQLKFNKTQLRQFKVLCPPIEIQKRVVSYLDCKCSQIDSIIAKQESLIEKLKEYKQSVITEAVSKGIKKDVEMQESTIDFCEKIPMHWKVLQNRYLFSLRDEKNYKALEDVQLLSLYTDLGVFPHGEQEERGNKAVTAEGYKNVYEDDIVVNIILAWMGAIGRSAYDGVTSPAYDIYRPRESVCSRFYHYLYRTKAFSAECYKYGRGIMAMRWRTYSSEFKSIRVPVPPYKEQIEIADYLDEKCASIEKTINDRQVAIDKLQEYKKSLIYEVVTGKKEV